MKDELKSANILRSWTRKKLKRPSDLNIVIDLAKHHDQPLFHDLDVEVYLAPEYSVADRGILQELGVSNISWPALLTRLEADLRKSDSKIRTRPALDPWHISFSSLLLAAFDGTANNESVRQSLRSQAINPLSDGAWTSASRAVSNVFFPTTESITVPQDLSFKLIEWNASSVLKRATLFKHLGISDCPRDTVCVKILALHRQLYKTAQFSIPQAIAHYRYLFWFHKNPDHLKGILWAPTEAGAATP